MKISITIWKIMMSAGYHIPYIFIIAVLVLLEQHFIRIKSRGKTILPIMVLCVTLVFSFVQFRYVNFNEPDSLMTEMEYNSRSGVKSHFSILHTEEEQILAIGQLITEEDTDSKFINLAVKNGKIISTSEPVDMIESIESSLSSFEGSYSGESIPYGKLLELEEQYKKQQPYQIDFVTFLYRFFYSLIPAVILFIMYGIDRIKRSDKA